MDAFIHKNKFLKKSLSRTQNEFVPNKVFYSRGAQPGGQGGPSLGRPRADRAGHAKPGPRQARARPRPRLSCSVWPAILAICFDFEGRR